MDGLILDQRKSVTQKNLTGNYSLLTEIKSGTPTKYPSIFTLSKKFHLKDLPNETTIRDGIWDT